MADSFTKALTAKVFESHLHGLGPTVAAEGKGKAKVAIKGKCFHYNVDGHWKRNCPKYLAKKKEKEGEYDLLVLETCLVENDQKAWILDSRATNHVCYSLQKTISFKQLEEGEMTLMHKSEALEKFKEYKAEVENLLSKKIKILRSDRGGEYMDLRFQDYMIEHGIQSQLSAPGTVQQNGVLERRNRTLLDMVHSMMIYAQFPSSFWGGRIVSQPNRYLGLTETQVVIPDYGVEDPLSYKQAMNDVDKDQWVKVMDLEMESRHGVHLSKEQCPKTPQEVDDMIHIPYASTVDSLMYAMLCTRPDICYAVGIVSSIKQGCIADSTMEAEYVTACEAAKDAVWLRKFLHDLEVVPNMNLPITLYCDNSGAVANSKEPHSHKRGKHIEKKYHLI
ncbi:gag/pol protein [Cucumis melo var. makuwa]|uniref:Gag/pol protein n=1 Tax=Cucumis melo var. makuwa TaxID=1194695 RepID=A0A5A7SZT7_CUCMM|nr:gag/pol protein [Cucumis melo var. makuwa]